MVGLEQEGVVRGWGNCLKYLKRRWNRKEETKILKGVGGGGQPGSRGGYLKKEGAGAPYELCR